MIRVYHSALHFLAEGMTIRLAGFDRKNRWWLAKKAAQRRAELIRSEQSAGGALSS